MSASCWTRTRRSASAATAPAGRPGDPPGETTDAQRIEKVFRTKQDAERWLFTMEADGLRGAYLDLRSGQVQFNAVVEEWKETWGRFDPPRRRGSDTSPS